LVSKKYASYPKSKNILAANFTNHAIGGCALTHYSNYANFIFNALAKLAVQDLFGSGLTRSM
jgi:hypothetical protein